MKKSLLALAALTAFAGAASAQSSVTLFGILDVGARSVKNGNTSLKTLSTDGQGSSQLGFRGIEDLGGGMRAGFWLEGTLGVDTGAAGAPSGAFFNRRSTASLLGGFGEVRLGRDYVPTFWNHTVFDPFGTNGVGSANNLMSQASATSGSITTTVLGTALQGPSGDARTGTFVRADNSVGYFLPAMGGLYGQLMVAAGEGRTGAKYSGGRLGYAAGPVNVAVAYGKTDLISNSLTAANVGGSFNLGFLTLTGMWSKYKIDAGEPTVGGRDQTNWYVGTIVPLGSGAIKASYGKVDGHINSAATTTDAKQFAVGYSYDLSKRTALYATYGRVTNSTGARFYASGSGPANSATGVTSTGYQFGMKHSF